MAALKGSGGDSGMTQSQNQNVLPICESVWLFKLGHYPKVQGETQAAQEEYVCTFCDETMDWGRAS
jgi:hypothetical protein